MCARQARVLLVVLLLCCYSVIIYITAYFTVCSRILLCMTVYSLRIYACVYVFTEKRDLYYNRIKGSQPDFQ